MTTSIDNMNSITSIIQQHSTAMEAALSHRTAEANAELLAALAKEYGFDLEEATAKFLPERKDSVRTTTSKGKKAQKGKKAKKVKDPTKPKRGKNAFMLYSAAVRAETKEANPDLKPTEIAKLLGTQWKDLPQEEKLPYEEAAAVEGKRYEDEMKAWKEKQGSDEELEISSLPSDEE